MLDTVARKLGSFYAMEKLALGQGVYAYTFDLVGIGGAEVTVLWHGDGHHYLPGETPPTRSVALSVSPQPYRFSLIPAEQDVPLPPPNGSCPLTPSWRSR